MSNYRRVLPRDLFNEASLLKCYGALWIAIDNMGCRSAVITPEDVDTFDIVQNADSGGLMIYNVRLMVRGQWAELERPLNSRQPWPLYVTGYGADPDFDPIAVFNDDGTLSDEMRVFLAE